MVADRMVADRIVTGLPSFQICIRSHNLFRISNATFDFAIWLMFDLAHIAACKKQFLSNLLFAKPVRVTGAEAIFFAASDVTMQIWIFCLDEFNWRCKGSSCRRNRVHLQKLFTFWAFDSQETATVKTRWLWSVRTFQEPKRIEHEY